MRRSSVAMEVERSSAVHTAMPQTWSRRVVTTPPARPAATTPAHADHAPPGHGTVLATPETLAIMAERYGADFAGSTQALAYGEAVQRNGVEVKLVPAGHVLGSAQAVVRCQGLTMVVSGAYKRRRDPP